MDLLIFPVASFVLMVVALHLAVAFYMTKRKTKSSILATENVKDLEEAVMHSAPGPLALPVIGNLHTMARFGDDPYSGFQVLSKEYGPVFQITLGQTRCLIVSDFETIKEVLIKKGNTFDGRPDFLRWNNYFNGDRQKSIALCDYTEVQKTRRNVMRSFLMLRPDTDRFNDLDSWISTEMHSLLEAFAKTEGQAVAAKDPIASCALNIFTGYMCSTRFDYDDEKFKNIVNCFDFIFEDINNGHPTDFMPWMSPLFKSYENKVRDTTTNIRKFILEEVIKDRCDTVDPNNVRDLLDGLLINYFNKDNGSMALDWQNTLFALEDLLGGSSSISNVLMRVFAYLIQNPNVQKNIHKEIDQVIGQDRLPSLSDRNEMKYCEAVIWESLRHTSSPIVPHVANEDSSLSGYSVEKGTVVIINNPALNSSESLWDKPLEFKPERFIVDGQIKKPAHFMPFSTGKRSCIGSRILLNATFAAMTTLLQKYTVSSPQDQVIRLPPNKISIEAQGFQLIMTPRA